MDGRLYGVCFCCTSRIRGRESPRRSIPTSEASAKTHLTTSISKYAGERIKFQVQTVAVFDGHGTNVRSRKHTTNSQTPTTPVQVSIEIQFKVFISLIIYTSSLPESTDKYTRQWWPQWRSWSRWTWRS